MHSSIMHPYKVLFKNVDRLFLTLVYNSGWIFFFLKSFIKKFSLSKIFLFNHRAVCFFHVELLSSTRRSSQPVRFRTYILISNLATARVCNFFERPHTNTDNRNMQQIFHSILLTRIKLFERTVTTAKDGWLFLSLSSTKSSTWRVKKCWKTWECKYGRPAGKAGHANGPPGLNFINVLLTAFTLAEPKSVKRYWWLTCIFLPFWDLWAQKMLVERWWNWHLVCVCGNSPHARHGRLSNSSIFHQEIFFFDCNHLDLMECLAT